MLLPFVRLLAVFAPVLLGLATAQAGAPLGYLIDSHFCGSTFPNGFTPAQAIEKLKPSYPYKALNDWGEGWVLAEFAVTPEGTVRDPFVVDAIGAKDFVASVMEALALQRFKPATRNGVPVDQHLRSVSVFYLFEDSEAAVIHQEFLDRFTVARNRFDSNRVDDGIYTLEQTLKWRLNLYEHAMSSYLLALGYAKKEAWAQARYHIEHALSYDGQYLNKSMIPAAMELLVKLRAQDGDMAAAWCGFRRLDARQRAALSSLETEIRARLTSDAPLVSDAVLLKHPLADQPGTWRRTLRRRTFSFANISGDVKSFHLACIAAAQDAAVDTQTRWTVPEQAGTCAVRVSGAPGATFKLVEEW